MKQCLTCYLGSGLFSLGAGFLALAGEPRATIQPPPWPEVPTRVARHSVQSPFLVQAQNGLRLDQTVWNHHFDLEDPAQLSHSGMALLDRLARRYVECGCALELYLQTDRALPFHHEKPNQVAQERAEQDHKRLLSIGAYLAANWPGVQVDVHVYDPNVPGMRGLEGVLAVQEMWRGARGVIPPEIQGGLSISPQKLLSGAAVTGPISTPSPVSSGSGSISALGGGPGGGDSGGSN